MLLSNTALTKTGRQGCVPVENSASFPLIYAQSISACLSALHFGTEIVLGRIYLRTEQKIQGFTIRIKKKKRNKNGLSSSLVKNSDSYIRKWGLFRRQMQNRGRWTQSMRRSTYIYAGPDRYINTHKLENTLMWCSLAWLCVFVSAQEYVCMCGRLSTCAMWECEAAETHRMHERWLLRDRSMSSCAGVQGAIVPRDADYRRFGGGQETTWHDTTRGVGGLILMGVMTKCSRLQLQKEDMS